MPIVERNGTKLSVIAEGDGAPALIFSHGFLMDTAMYSAQAEAFRATNLCVRWDQRGHGATEDSGKPFSYWDSAADLLAIMDSLGLDRAVLVGLSQGGFLSMRAALQAPDRVAGLVLVSTQAGVDTEEVYDNFRGLKAEWAANGSANAGPGVASMLIGDSTAEGEWLKKWTHVPGDRLGPCIDALIDRDDITDRLPEITCPSIVIHGDADNAIPAELGRKLAEGLPNCLDFVLIPGAAHAPPLTHPAPVNSAIARLLAEVG
jgi:pimeloyl-ACP methyl ester carboxylesterase